jgi:hypothetical protein
VSNTGKKVGDADEELGTSAGSFVLPALAFDFCERVGNYRLTMVAALRFVLSQIARHCFSASPQASELV